MGVGIWQVMNKWLGLQASAAVEGNVGVCERLLTHPAFDLSEPNKVYALVGGFCGTPLTFHANDGSGYRFLADCVLKLDDRNPQVGGWGGGKGGFGVNAV